MRKRPPGWHPPGPVPPGALGCPELVPGPGETLDCLSGHWKIFQLRDGHRYSTDDLLTAWFAADRYRDGGGEPKEHLDLGCGVFSVGLLLLWRFLGLRSLGIEAQGVSAALAARSLRFNGAWGRGRVANGDFREVSVPAPGEAFDLVTGSPPYLVPGEGTRSFRPQRGPCRFEDRGGITDYLAKASRHLAPGGAFVWCHATRYAGENLSQARTSGLGRVQWREVVFREGKESLISLFRAEAGEGPAEKLPPLVVRTARGDPSPDYRRIRGEMGFPATPLPGAG
ncbi:MAG: SAM-dependent methyltransferase [Deltaproteobacteria bacterium]|nr:SAM-dependent methyltransferase [Deltaproteobacteria bacterium]